MRYLVRSESMLPRIDEVSGTQRINAAPRWLYIMAAMEAENKKKTQRQESEVNSRFYYHMRLGI